MPFESTSHYSKLSSALDLAQKTPSPVIHLDEDPQSIITELNKQLQLFKDLPNEKNQEL